MLIAMIPKPEALPAIGGEGTARQRRLREPAHSNERFIYDDCKTSFDAGLSDVVSREF